MFSASSANCSGVKYFNNSAKKSRGSGGAIFSTST
ncbi:MAG TPA: hypothetical protein ENI29_10815 [bacterium]|nr:hypothetical protein [bacterium]